jgi:O-antigen/teichoic acid export membrane protein
MRFGSVSGSGTKETEETPNEAEVVLESVEKRVSHGLVALVIRQFIAYGTLFLGNILLARWVSPDIYGLFAATLAFQSMLVVLADVGLGPALIQRDQNPTRDEIAGLFTVQVVLFGFVAGGIWVFAPWIAVVADLELAGELIVRSIAVVFFITAFRSIPAILLERDLRFDAIALVETVSTIIYQVVLLVLVWRGTGLISIVWALAARYTCDMLLIWRLHPWRPRLSWNLRPIISYLSFGLNMQGVRIMVYIKDHLPLLLIVPLLGATSAGHWGWSLTYIGIPVYFNQLITRIMFPAYSRVQSDRDAVGALATTALWLNMSIGLPIIFILIWFAPHLVPLIYGNVWLAALPIAILLAPNMLAGFMTGALFPVLYATNQSRKALKLFVLWVILTVSGSLIGVMYGDLQGMALAYSCTTLIISIVLLFSVRPVAAVDLKKALVGPFVSLFGMIFGVAALVSVNTSWVFVLVFVICSYIVTFCVIDYRRIRTLAVAFLA